MGYRIVFVGLVNFFELDEDTPGRLVLLPDGTNPPDGIDEHVASIIVHEDQVIAEETTWENTASQTLADMQLMQFRFSTPSRVEISGMEAAVPRRRGSTPSSSSNSPDSGTSDDEPFDDSDFERNIVRLRDIDPDIEIDPAAAVTIAQIPIRRGTLISRLIGGRAHIGELSVARHDGPVVIVTADGTLTLGNGTELVIANVSEAASGSNDPARSHFRIYGRLDRRQQGGLMAQSSATDIDARVNALGTPATESTHPYLDHVLTNVPDAQCTVTGCCACAGKHEG